MNGASIGRNGLAGEPAQMISSRLSSKPASRPVRAAKVLIGFALLIVGGVLAIPGVPGPGIPIILLGLWVLSDHFAWARRSLAWVKQRAARYRQTSGKRRGGRWKCEISPTARHTRKVRQHPSKL